MGYTTNFKGSFKLDKPLTLEQYGLLRLLPEELQELTNLGIKNIPNSYCQWEIQKDRTCLEWDGGEKFYYYVEWLDVFCQLFSLWGYKLNGTVKYQGEDIGDCGELIVKDNQVGKTEYATEKEKYEAAKECCLLLLDNYFDRAKEAAEKWRSMAL